MKIKISPNIKTKKGLYVGRAGIAYMLWYVSAKQPDLAHNLESARELANAHYR